ncbi:Type I restriction-modification system, specificity subunit S HsdS [Tenacibaculum finnmarkense genomovar ulcerans]|uniref:Type I restriction-modification system, specificity subunit S HsdS n=1 Tax=Tenacibaculum finnmarkense genomovar ulcerans TaxID=2781388 RepID=A0A2I2MBH4_9FLAO|nr:restriction endonuclease subunit S [Tenacibaculum finnmarkense]SOU89895.1 Type I restriction-modification system, specificity subunit S HsdS [Tenacibaculum finnmarkense genomovar ulcerans]
MQLLKHFKELTVNPKNAKELKGLILQLAIQGKLTANWRKENTNIEPSSELLKKIQKEKERLIKEKKIRKEKPLLKIDKEEIPYKLPENWVWCRLGNSGFTQTGNTPPKNNPENYGDFIPFIGPADISNQLMKYPVEGLSELGISVGRLIPKESLMMVCIGGSIGKCNINYIDVSCNQQINTVTPVLIPVIYIKTVCQSPFFQKKVLDNSSGSATPIINKGKWETLLFPLPPLEEQKEIVKVVETLFKEVDKLEQLTVSRISLKEDFVRSALKELTNNNTKKEWDYLQEHFKSFFNETTNIKKLRETVLQLAVQGKLTADWRANNPRTEDATILLKRIQKEKAQLIEDKKIKKEKILPKITKEEIPYKIPDGWVWCRMGTISDIIAGASFKSGDFNKTGGVKCIKITNAGVRIFVETNDYLPKGFDKLHLNYLIKEGDLILALTRPYIKDGLKISICPSTYNNSLLNQRVASIRSMTKEIYHPYIFSYIQSPKVLSFYKSKFDGKSQQPNMKMWDITDLLISVPPLEEQKAIVEKVNALMSLCDKLEQEVQQSEAHSKQLMKSCLKEVFVG